MNFDEAIKKCNASGWLIVALHQYSPSHWRCHISRKASGPGNRALSEYADGATALAALLAAMQDAGQPRNLEPKARLVKAAPLPFADGLTYEQEVSLARVLERLDTAIQAYMEG